MFNMIFPGNFVQIGRLGNAVVGDASWVIGGIIGGALGTITTAGLAGSVPGALIGAGGAQLLVSLIFSILIFILFIRLIWLFLGAYIHILVAIIFSPVFLIAGIFPGNDSFASWFKTIIGNLSVFVVAGILMMTATKMITTIEARSGGSDVVSTPQIGAVGLNSPDQAIWVPPYVSFTRPTANGVTALLAIGMLLLIPTFAGQVKQMIMDKTSGVPIGNAMNLSFLTQIGGFAMNQWTMSRYHNEEMKRRSEMGQPEQPLTATDALGPPAKH
jgi:hypothetical protein